VECRHARRRPRHSESLAKDQVACCFLNWTAKGENRVGLAVASHRRTLKPGDRLTLDADYGIH